MESSLRSARALPQLPLTRGVNTLAVVGNVNRDLRAAPLAPGSHLFRDGETSVNSILETLGGGGANSAAFAALLGARVRLVAKVGHDPLGERLGSALRRRGVRPFLAHDPANPTGTSVNLVYETGRRHFVSCLPASGTLAFEDIPIQALRGAAHVLRADVWFSEPMLFGGNRRLFVAAKDAGADTSLDVNWDPAWRRGARRRIEQRKRAVRSVLPLVDVVHGNVPELCAFADVGTLPAALKRLAAWGAGSVVIHMGSKGAGHYRAGRLTTRPCVPASRAVNATGSGDLLSVIMMLLHRDGRGEGAKLDLANRIVSAYVEGSGVFAKPGAL